MTPLGGGRDPFPFGGPQEPVATPEGSAHGSPEDQTKVAKWADAPAVPGPDVPPVIDIAVPEHAPVPAGWRPEGTRSDPRFGGPPVLGADAAQDRRAAWGEYRRVVAETVADHNALVGPISTYKNVSADPKAAHAGAAPPDMAQRALGQVVPRTSASKVTVGSLFTPGAELKTQGLEDNMARAKASGAVERQRALIDAAELGVLGQLKALNVAVLKSREAGKDLEAATAGVEL
jgi:hypothetical protein